MARFEMELPNEELNQILKIDKNADRIFGEMTKAGAEHVKSVIASTAPLECLKKADISRVYKTPTDDGINTKVFYKGIYDPDKAFTRRGRNTNRTQYTSYKGKPLEFIAMVTEYGTSPRYTNSGAYRGYVGKRPYFRKAFKKDEIQKIMMDVQKRETGGLLDE